MPDTTRDESSVAAYAKCPRCPWGLHISDVDPAASVDDLRSHIEWLHGLDRNTAWPMAAEAVSDAFV